MTNQTQVIKIIAEQMATQEVSPEMSFEDLGGDSLDEIEILMALEEHFAIIVGDKQAEQIKTVQQAIDYVDAKLAKINCMPVKSSQMEAIGHEGRTLAVQFKNGLYHYPGVTAELRQGHQAAPAVLQGAVMQTNWPSVPMEPHHTAEDAEPVASDDFTRWLERQRVEPVEAGERK